MPSQQAPDAGDRVGVPWGLDVLEGIVLRIYGAGSDAHAVVSVNVPGADNEPEPQVVTLRASDLLSIDEGDELKAPGSWINEYQFARAVQEALDRAVRKFAVSAVVETEPRLGGKRPDAIVRFGDHLVIVEVKINVQKSTAIDQLTSYLHEARDNNPEASVGGMLVLQSEPQAQVVRELRDLGVAAVNWNTPRDDPKLAAALTRLLEAA